MPVRKIPIGNRAVTGQHARSGERYESSLERDFFELMMADPLVEDIDSQPVCIKYVSSQKKRLRYTPDALVTFKCDPLTGLVRPPLLCEVKYRDQYKKEFQELKEKIRVGRRYAKERNWQFKVVTDREIRTPYFSNIHFLAGFRDREPDSARIDVIVGQMTHADTITPSSLLSKITLNRWEQAEILPTLWWLVANSKLKVDLSVPVSMNSPIWLPT